MDKPRFLLAIVLCLAVLLLWNYLFPAPRRLSPPLPVASRPGTTSAPAAAASPDAAPTASAPGLRSTLEGPSEDVLLETAELRIVLSGTGAVAKEARLRRFYADAAAERNPSEKPEDWLSILRAPGGGSATFGLRDHAGSLGLELDRAPWAFVPLSADGALLARCPLSNGLTFEKEFRPGKAPFTVEVVLRVANEDRAAVGRDLLLSFSPASSIFPYGDSFYADPVAVAALKEGYSLKAKQIVAKPDGGKEPRPFPAGEVLWAGSMNKYFAVLARPLAPSRFVFARALPLLDPEAPPARPWRLLAPECGLSFHVNPPGEVEEKRIEIYLGPKRPADLREAEPTYREVHSLDYGVFGWVSRIVLWILGLFHSITASWGASIMLLTCLVRSMLFPLNRHQQVSMARFSEKQRRLQPQLDELKRRFKNDFRKFNEAQGRLYKEHGLRPPFLGCMLMFVQLPVWYGLFSALRVSFDLRHAPFLWIEDLSQPDRTLAFGFALPWPLRWTHLNVLPLSMMVVWWLQQRMAPKPADPQMAAQMRVVQYLPFLFGFMFYTYPAGLSLYWLVSSSLGILESKIIRRQTGLAVRPTS
ncbi:MAG TPA: YidC/Oxa1 family insertase periplasmic-domain containing protein [Planctomycetota bacterium]|nr:YidC/Oxa1 family insertase periplasmic-domain containing protein [Planctomycetota bacterium]